MELARATYRATMALPEDERFGLTSQMRRAAVSVPSNIAEGAARGSQREYLQFLYTSRGSLAELRTQLILAEQLELIPNQPDDPPAHRQRVRPPRRPHQPPQEDHHQVTSPRSVHPSCSPMRLLLTPHASRLTTWPDGPDSLLLAPDASPRGRRPRRPSLLTPQGPVEPAVPAENAPRFQQPLGKPSRFPTAPTASTTKMSLSTTFGIGTAAWLGYPRSSDAVPFAGSIASSPLTPDSYGANGPVAMTPKPLTPTSSLLTSSRGPAP